MSGSEGIDVVVERQRVAAQLRRMRDEHLKLGRRGGRGTEGRGRGGGGGGGGERGAITPVTPSDAASRSKGLIEKDDDIIFHQLRKVYPRTRLSPSTTAVADLSFGITRGECFGLLGVNGAGKSTTMKILCREVRASKGSVWLRGRRVTGIYDENDDGKGREEREREKERERERERGGRRRGLLGYCSQENTLLDQLTVEEHLGLFLSLSEHGQRMGKKEQEEYITTFLRALNIEKFARQKAETLSGGNKRKLCLAVRWC